MGKTFTPTYRLEVTENARKSYTAPLRGMHNTFGWKAKEYGKPTTANLEKWITAYHESLKLGGCNEHLSRSLGYLPTLKAAKIIRQSTGEVMAEWNAPAFMAF